MQAEFAAEFPDLDVQFLGINQSGLEIGNDSITEGKDIPWLQDVDSDADGNSDVWTQWNKKHLDVVVLDGHNEEVGGINLVGHSLGEGENYSALRQLVLDAIVMPQPLQVDLLANADSGADATDNYTNFNNSSPSSALQFRVPGVTDGATVTLFIDGTPAGQAVATSGTAVIATDGTTTILDGTHAFTATQETDGVSSDPSIALDVTVDTTIGQFTTSPPVSASAHVGYTHDVQNVDEGEWGFAYSLEEGPEGLSIDAATGFVSWTPTSAQIGLHELTVVATDLAGNNRSQHGDIVVTANTSIVAADDEFTVDEDSRDVLLDVLLNDTLESGATDPLVLTSVGTPSQGGSVRIASDGSGLVYTPQPDYFGDELLTYVIRSGDATDEARVRINVRAVNDPPTAFDDTEDVSNGQAPYRLDVLRNDSIAPDVGETLSVIEASAGSQGGQISIIEQGQAIEYTPATDFTGQESFTYTVRDTGGARDTAAVTVTVRDFAPSQLGGVVYLDSNGSGHLDGNEQRLGHVHVTLSGTNFLGDTVSRATRTAADGSYLFADVAPGEYEIVEEQPLYLVDGSESVGSHGEAVAGNDRLFVSLGEGMEALGNDFGERGLKAEMVSVGLFFASSPRTAAMAAATPNGCHWFTATDDWGDVQSASFQLPEDESSVVLTLEDAGQSEIHIQLDGAGSRQTRVWGHDRGAALIQVAGRPMEFLAHSTAVATVADRSAEGRGTTADGEPPESFEPAAISARALTQSRTPALARADNVVGTSPTNAAGHASRPVIVGNTLNAWANSSVDAPADAEKMAPRLRSPEKLSHDVAMEEFSSGWPADAQTLLPIEPRNLAAVDEGFAAPTIANQNDAPDELVYLEAVDELFADESPLS